MEGDKPPEDSEITYSGWSSELTYSYIFKAFSTNGKLHELPSIQFIMKTLFFIALIAVIAQATPTIRNVSTLTLCATIIMIGN